MLQHFESLDVTNSPRNETGNFLQNIKTYIRHNIFQATQRMLCSLQDVFVPSKYLINGVEECE